MTEAGERRWMDGPISLSGIRPSSYVLGFLALLGVLIVVALVMFLAAVALGLILDHPDVVSWALPLVGGIAFAVVFVVQVAGAIEEARLDREEENQ